MNDFDFLYSNLDQYSDQNSNDIEILVPDIVLVEDDTVLGKTIKKYVEKTTKLNVHYVKGPSECLELLADVDKSSNFCLISDISFEDGGADGLLLIDLLKERGLKFTSIVMTGFASIETAINATKKGVYHYLTKPFDLDVLTDLILKAYEEVYKIDKKYLTSDKAQVEVVREERRERRSSFKIEAPTKDDMFCGMIGRSKVMRDVFERIQKVAASDSTILINGPSGTGKELVASAVHKLSPRNSGGIVSVNCGAIPGELLESELFGHERGAFTGAISARKGRFEIADKGTIFLDEIGDMPLLLQVKLLRVLQNRTIERVGSTSSMPVDVRIITATHRNLEQAVSEGNFREDLYYRLNVIPIKVPALSERREDIPLLISYFLSRFVSADGRNNVEFDDDALEVLMTYDWPGNVRELENLMERLVILKGGSLVKASDLPGKFLTHCSKRFSFSSAETMISLPEDGIDLKKVLSEIEDSLIEQALERTSGNKNQASRLLSMNRTTLIEKMKKKGLSLEV